MYVHRQTQASGLAGNVVEKKILEAGVIMREWNIAFDEMRINLLDQLNRFVRPKIERAQVSSFKLDGHGPVLLLHFKYGRYDFGGVFLEGGRRCLTIYIFQVTAQQHGFSLKEKLAVRRFTSQAGVFQRIHQSVIKGDPAKARRLQAASQGYAIGEFDFNAKLVQGPIGKIIAL